MRSTGLFSVFLWWWKELKDWARLTQACTENWTLHIASNLLFQIAMRVFLIFIAIFPDSSFSRCWQLILSLPAVFLLWLYGPNPFTPLFWNHGLVFTSCLCCRWRFRRPLCFMSLSMFGGFIVQLYSWKRLTSVISLTKLSVAWLAALACPDYTPHRFSQRWFLSF